MIPVAVVFVVVGPRIQGARGGGLGETNVEHSARSLKLRTLADAADAEKYAQPANGSDAQHD